MKRLFVLIAVAALAGAAHAADPGPYAGVSGGSSTVKGFCDGAAAAGVTCDDSGSSFRIFGGYQANPNVAFELGYADLGKVSGSIAGLTASVSASAFDVSALFGIPLGDKAQIFTRLGVYHASGDLDSNFGLSGSGSSTDLTVGVGFRFDVSKDVALRAEWQRYSAVGDDAIGRSDVDVIGGGVLFKF